MDHLSYSSTINLMVSFNCVYKILHHLNQDGLYILTNPQCKYVQCVYNTQYDCYLLLQIHQYVVDEFIDNPMCSSIHISVYAEIGVAKKPLHCPIELTGIDPSKIIYINRTPPPSSMS